MNEQGEARKRDDGPCKYETQSRESCHPSVLAMNQI